MVHAAAANPMQQPLRSLGVRTRLGAILNVDVGTQKFQDLVRSGGIWEAPKFDHVPRLRLCRRRGGAAVTIANLGLSLKLRSF